jgi:hypothetical protein
MRMSNRGGRRMMPKHLAHRPVSTWLHFERIYEYLKEFYPDMIKEALTEEEE